MISNAPECSIRLFGGKYVSETLDLAFDLEDFLV